MTRVRKAVIPAAGLGTRFLPATKTVPKEMLTIVDAPIIFYVVEEAIQAGIEDIFLIQGRGKTAIEDFFDTSYELEDRLEKDGKTYILERLIRIRKMANIISIRQKQPLGLGHAVLCAAHVIGDEPFAVLLGDEIMVSSPGEKKTTTLLTELYEDTLSPCVAVMEVPREEVCKYGIADLMPLEGFGPGTQGGGPQRFRVKGFVEKPRADKAPSQWAIPGRYVFTPDIFDDLQSTVPGMHSEIQLTDSMDAMSKRRDFFASAFLAERFDAGDKFGYLRANVEMGLKNSELKREFRDYLIGLAKRLEGTEAGYLHLTSFVPLLLSATLFLLLVLLFFLGGVVSPGHLPQARAYIPPAAFVLQKIAQTRAGGSRSPYLVEQEVRLGEVDPVFIKETWWVEGDSSMRLQITGLRPHSMRDRLRWNFTYSLSNLSSGSSSTSGASPTSPSSGSSISTFTVESFFHFKNWVRLTDQLVRMRILPLQFFQLRSQTMAQTRHSSKEFSYVPEPFVHLSRVGGQVVYAMDGGGFGSGASSSLPGLWVEQDQFFIRKLRFLSGSTISAQNYQSFGKNFYFPKMREIFWSGKRAQITTSTVSFRSKPPPQMLRGPRGTSQQMIQQISQQVQAQRAQSFSASEGFEGSGSSSMSTSPSSDSTAASSSSLSASADSSWDLVFDFYKRFR